MKMVAVHRDGHVESAKGSKMLATKCWRYRGLGRLFWRRGSEERWGTARPSIVLREGKIIYRFCCTWEVIEAAGFRVQSPVQDPLPF